MFKKSVAALLALAMLFVLASCGGNTTNGTTATDPTTAQPADTVTAKVITLKGPTGMGMSKMMNDASKSYAFTLAAAPDEVTSAIISGSADIAACPVNLAAVLNSKTNGGVQLIAINTLGVLYILTNGVEVSSVADLKGKTVYAAGQGTSPEFVFNYLLEKNGIDPASDLTVEWAGEHAEVAAKAVSGEKGVYLLPEPNVTTVVTKNSDVKVALDITAEWNKISEVRLAQGCVVVRKEFAQAHPQAVADFLKEYAASVDFVNNSPEEASAMIEAAQIVPSAAIALKAIERSNIVCITGTEMTTLAKANLQVLFDANPKSVGGALPDDSFYYTAN